MKHFLIILLYCTILSQAVHAQESPKKIFNYNTKVNLIPSSQRNGFLVTISDSSLYLSVYPRGMHLDQVQLSDLQKFNYKNIQGVRMQRKGSVGRGILYGALSGLVLGTIYGLVYPISDYELIFFSRAFYTGSYAIAGTAIGAGIGAIVGAVSSKKFLINGEWKNLQEMKEYLQNK